MDINELVEMARKARENSYAPYSGFRVGAAVLTDTGVFTGANVENISYGLTVCAERVAIFKAVTEGSSKISAMAIYAVKMPYPCGACLQVMDEFCDDDCTITVTNGKEIKTLKLSDLLPHPFSEDTL
jgi:cytidine deaminase